MWNCTATSISWAKISPLKSLHISDKSLYLQEEDRSRMYVKICIYSVPNYPVRSWRSVCSVSQLSEKASVTMNSRSFQNKNTKNIHTKLNALNLCHSHTIYGDLSSCLGFDIHQRKAWIRVGPPSRSESQNLIKMLRKLIQVILQALWKEYSVYLIPLNSLLV